MITLFQSTLPARGATRRHRRHIATYTISIHAPRTGSDPPGRSARGWHPPFQSTLPARGATDLYAREDGFIPFQSTLPARGATCPRRGIWRTMRFQSTLPARGATRARRVCGRAVVISIHAPRTGSDVLLMAKFATAPDFNPRSPHGERLNFRALSLLMQNFNPRSPHGERRNRNSLQFAT